MRRGGVVMVLGFVIALGFQSCGLERSAHENEKIYPISELEHFIDGSNAVTINEILRKDANITFRKSTSYQNKDFIPDASYWIRFRPPALARNNSVSLIEFYDQSIDSIQVFRVQKNGVITRLDFGDHLLFGQRQIRHKNFEFLVDPVNDTGVYYFRIRSHSFADIRIAYRTIERFIQYSINEYALFGMFYGMILIIALYNLIAYFAIREIKNIFYIFYILSVAFYASSLDGIGFQYIWPGSPNWNDRSAGVALYLVILWALLFTRRFLSTRARVPHLDRLLRYTIVGRSAFFISGIIYPPLLTYQVIDILPLLLIFYTGIFVWSRKYQSARYFVIAYGLLFVGFFIKTLVYFNVLPFTIISHYSLHIAFVLEMLFLTVALGDRIRILKGTRDRALRRIIQQNELNLELKDKVNRELEKKVSERTLELDNKNRQLEESNLKLIKQANEINQINSILDLDNWKLKNKIKEVLEERLMEKTMTYEEFRTLYPNKITCYRFLDELKSRGSFGCRKCNNNKYFAGTTKFSKRCTRCGYQESITAGTIFHAIKIPIEKAFFIAYLTVAGKKGYTLETLSNQLELRLNTVWAFKKRVLEHVELMNTSGQKPSSWADVIVTGTASPNAEYLKRNRAKTP